MRFLLVGSLLFACAPHPVEPTEDDRGHEADGADPLSGPDAASSTEGERLERYALPILLVHGFAAKGEVDSADGTAFDHFFLVREVLEEQGFEVFAPSLPPLAPSTVRAVVLGEAIDEVLASTGAPRVHLLGHSQGGVDARVVSVTHAEKIATLTTVSAPHGGTPIAELAGLAGEDALDGAGQVFAALTDSTEWTPELAESVGSLTPSAAAALVEEFPVPVKVPFFTVAGVSALRSLDHEQCAGSVWSASTRVDDLDPIFAANSLALGDVLHDGLIPVASARAAGGTFLGCVPADHNDEIGQPLDLVPGVVSGFDHRELYVQLAENARNHE